MNLRKYLLLGAAVLAVTMTASRAQAQSGTTAQNGNRITCASDDGRRHYCSIFTGRGARLVNQRSGSPCNQGSTWGYDRNGIWVDRGCRADFIVDAGGGGGGGGGNWNGGGGGGYPPPGRPPSGGGTITCSSNDGRRNFCDAYTGRGVRLVNQRSGSPCVQGQTWGYNGKGVWVDRGCRADFLLGR